MSASFDLTKIDLYDVLGVPPDATEKDVIKAYRKKALKYHPDKNPDPSAVEIFHKLSKALEILTDSAAKAAYDKILKARAAAQLRDKRIDSKRRKLKHDLEAREQAGLSSEQKRAEETKRLLTEVERLRKEGSALLEREKCLLREELARESKKEELHTNNNMSLHNNKKDEPMQIKLRWKSPHSDTTNGGYNEQLIRNIFEKYGHVETVLVSKKKNGTAVLEFKSSNPKLLSVDTEKGLDTHPLTVKWLSGRPSDQSSAPFAETTPVMVEPHLTGRLETSDTRNGTEEPHEKACLSDIDFEEMVLRRMKEAEKEKKLEQKEESKT